MVMRAVWYLLGIGGILLGLGGLAFAVTQGPAVQYWGAYGVAWICFGLVSVRNMPAEWSELPVVDRYVLLPGMVCSVVVGFAI